MRTDTKKGSLLDFFDRKSNLTSKQLVVDLTSDNEDDLTLLSAPTPSLINDTKNNNTKAHPSSLLTLASSLSTTIVLSDDDDFIPTPVPKKRRSPPSPPSSTTNHKRPAHYNPTHLHSVEHPDAIRSPARVLPTSFTKASSLLTTEPKPYFYQQIKTITPTKQQQQQQQHQRPSTKDNSSTEHLPTLSDEQQRVLNMAVQDRQSVFFTGSAGTGKSVLMRAMISALRKKYGSDVAVTASTGIAACNINGCTLHSFAGIGLGMEPVEKLIEKIEYRKTNKDRWMKTKVLIIDEISMVDATLFDKLETIARKFRVPHEPFGGIQLIVTGDFFQLPPVKSTGFAFEAKSWPNVMKKTVVLNHVFRQKDQVFVDVLNEMRLGKLSSTAIKLFLSMNRPLPPSKIDPAELYPLRWQVEQSNNSKLDALKGTIREFRAIDSGLDPRKMESCIAPALIRLKKDAQVMLLKNMDPRLVNGSLGLVVGFAGDENYNSIHSLRCRLAPNRRGEPPTEMDLQDIMDQGYPIVRFANDKEIVVENDRWSQMMPDGTELASRSQIPLILAWAMSIHKSQGQTLERVKVDLGRSFEDGMAYVALSRATSLESLQIINFTPSKVTASAKVGRFYQSLETV